VLAPDVEPGDEEFDLFVKEVAREMTVKAGQKCTAIRRAIVPRKHVDEVAARIKARLAKVVGRPRAGGSAHGRARVAGPEARRRRAREGC
jgi:oxepin-CoA hydrolase/3-oxo-5,6-dehydrosuberyl-CoA semialdehyde dehydrogenase